VWGLAGFSHLASIVEKAGLLTLKMFLAFYILKYGVSEHLGEIGAESNHLCRRFLLLLHPHSLGAFYFAAMSVPSKLYSTLRSAS